MTHFFNRWRFMVLLGLLVSVIAGGLTFLWPLQYRADAQVLIISKSRYGVDPYTVVKSAERVGENLVEIMKTDDFLVKVRATPGFNLDWSAFDTLNERQKRKAWPKMINGSVVYGTGVLNVSSYHQNPDTAKQLAGAVAQTLADKAWEYVGGDVILKVVNTPVATRFPVKPNPFMNAALGFVAGALLAALIIARPRA